MKKTKNGRTSCSSRVRLTTWTRTKSSPTACTVRALLADTVGCVADSFLLASKEIQAHSPPLFEQATGPLSDEMKQQLTAIGMLAESEGEAAIKNQPHLAA